MRCVAYRAILALGLACVPAAALAQDMTDEAVDWSGFYVGINGGYATGTSDTTNSSITSNGSTVVGGLSGTFYGGDAVADIEGWLAGGDIGFNVQSGPVVFGIVADYQMADIGRTDAFLGSPQGPYYESAGTLDSFGTIRGRLGVAAGQIMPYVTGGVAIGQSTLDLSISAGVPGNIFAGPFTDSVTQTVFGYAVGAGVDFALDDNWTVSAEYLHLGFGKASYDFNLDPGVLTSHADVQLDADILRMGISYGF